MKKFMLAMMSVMAINCANVVIVEESDSTSEVGGSGGSAGVIIEDECVNQVDGPHMWVVIENNVPQDDEMKLCVETCEGGKIKYSEECFVMKKEKVDCEENMMQCPESCGNVCFQYCKDPETCSTVMCCE